MMNQNRFKMLELIADRCCARFPELRQEWERLKRERGNAAAAINPLKERFRQMEAKQYASTSQAATPRTATKISE